MNQYTAPNAVFPGLFEDVQMSGIFPFAPQSQIKYGLSAIKKLRTCGRWRETTLNAKTLRRQCLRQMDGLPGGYGIEVRGRATAA